MAAAVAVALVVVDAIKRQANPKVFKGWQFCQPFLVALLVIQGSGSWGGEARADQVLRPAAPEDLLDNQGRSARKETVVKVDGAKVAWANYPALRRDFPSLREMSDAAIDGWILERFAFIATGQLELQGLRNSEIPLVAGETAEMHRLGAFRRAGHFTTG